MTLGTYDGVLITMLAVSGGMSLCVLASHLDRGTLYWGCKNGAPDFIEDPAHERFLSPRAPSHHH